MITTVSLNPSIDKTLFIETAHENGLNTVLNSREDPGGKGLNTGIAAHQLGLPTQIIGIDFIKGHKELEACLWNVPHQFITLPGSIRNNIKIFEQDTKKMTEYNELGGHIPLEAIDSFIELFISRVKTTEVLVLCGSCAHGIPRDIFARLVVLARKHSPEITIMMDTQNTLLAKGLAAKPNIIKPNLFELEELCGTKLASTEKIVAESRKIIDSGIEAVCVSLGEKGALMVTGSHVWHGHASIPLDIAGVIGAGDAMVSGICLAIFQKKTWKECLLYGIAAASAKVVLPGTQMCDSAGFKKALPYISVDEVFV